MVGILAIGIVTSEMQGGSKRDEAGLAAVLSMSGLERPLQNLLASADAVVADRRQEAHGIQRHRA